MKGATRESIGEAEKPHDDIRKQTVSGVVWLTLQKWAVRLLGLVTIGVLTRLLSPEDFGAVAAASTVLPFFYLLADFGFAAYIVQAARVDQRLLSTGFWFSSLAGFGLCALLVATAPLFGLVYKDSQTVPILQVLALSALITAVASVPTALLRRSMRFRAIATQGTIAAVSGQVVGIGMAVGGYGAWALVGQALVAGMVGSILAWIAAQWRPSFKFSRSNFLTMARFGSQVLGVEFVAMLRAWAEAAIVAATLGISALGYLSVAQRLVLVVQELTGGAVVPVSAVAFAKVRESSERLTKSYLRALRFTYAALSPPLLLVAVAAPLIVPIIFGPGWDDSSQLAQILALAGILTVGAALDHGLFYGMGKPGVWLVYALIIDALTVGTTALTSQWGLFALAWGFLVVALLATIARWFLVAAVLHARTRVVVRPFTTLCVSVLLAGMTGWLTMRVSNSIPPIWTIGLVGLAILLVQIVVLRFFARDVLADGMGLLRDSRWLKRALHLRKKSGRV